MSGDKIHITASGNIVLASLSNQTSTPDGINNSSSVSGTHDNVLQYGNLIYKVGETGKVHKAGTQKTDIITETGMLYISIYETVYDPNNQGKYFVHIQKD